MDFNILKSLKSGSGCTLEDYKFLYGFISLIGPNRILDIGSNYGLSAIAMAMALRDRELYNSRIVSVDIIENPYITSARENAEKLGLSRYIKFIVSDSSIARTYPHFDIVFIDGDHSKEGCLKDFHNVKDISTYVVIHDSISIDGVRDAVKLIREKTGYEILDFNVGRAGTHWSQGREMSHIYSGMAVVKTGK